MRKTAILLGSVILAGPLASTANAATVYTESESIQLIELSGPNYTTNSPTASGGPILIGRSLDPNSAAAFEFLQQNGGTAGANVNVDNRTCNIFGCTDNWTTVFVPGQYTGGPRMVDQFVHGTYLGELTTQAGLPSLSESFFGGAGAAYPCKGATDLSVIQACAFNDEPPYVFPNGDVGFGGLQLDLTGVQGTEYLHVKFSLAGVDYLGAVTLVRASDSELDITQVQYASMADLAAAAVPEPATWSLMILGIGGVGSMLRRRRAVALA